MLNIEHALSARYPGFFQGKPDFVTRPLLSFLRILFHKREINRFLEEHKGVEGLDFLEKVLEHFDFSYSVSNTGRENIPATGRVVIIANHPLGALDALALIKLVSEVRPDVKVVANDLLLHLRPMRGLFLPVDNLGRRTSPESVKCILRALHDEPAVILFPAGEVSRARPNGIRDGRWQSGFLRIARRANAPLLPVFIDGRNSPLFYGISAIYKPLAAPLLVQEMFNQHSKTIGIRIGALIPIANITSAGMPPKTQVKLVKRHLYKVGKNKRGVFATEKAIAHPEARQALKAELAVAQRLGMTHDGKAIFLFDPSPDIGD